MARAREFVAVGQGRAGLVHAVTHVTQSDGDRDARHDQHDGQHAEKGKEMRATPSPFAPALREAAVGHARERQIA